MTEKWPDFICGILFDKYLFVLFKLLLNLLSLSPNSIEILSKSSSIFISFFPIDKTKLILLIFSSSKFIAFVSSYNSFSKFNLFKCKNNFLNIKQKVLYGKVAIKGSILLQNANSSLFKWISFSSILSSKY